MAIVEEQRLFHTLQHTPQHPSQTTTQPSFPLSPLSHRSMMRGLPVVVIALVNVRPVVEQHFYYFRLPVSRRVVEGRELLPAPKAHRSALLQKKPNAFHVTKPARQMNRRKTHLVLLRL